jgi:hypothetical protein
MPGSPGPCLRTWESTTLRQWTRISSSTHHRCRVPQVRVFGPGKARPCINGPAFRPLTHHRCRVPQVRVLRTWHSTTFAQRTRISSSHSPQMPSAPGPCFRTWESTTLRQRTRISSSHSPQMPGAPGPCLRTWESTTLRQWTRISSSTHHRCRVPQVRVFGPGKARPCVKGPAFRPLTHHTNPLIPNPYSLLPTPAVTTSAWCAAISFSCRL